MTPTRLPKRSPHPPHFKTNKFSDSSRVTPSYERFILGNFEGALPLIENACESDPDNSNFLKCAYLANLGAGNVDRAVESLNTLYRGDGFVVQWAKSNALISILGNRKPTACRLVVEEHMGRPQARQAPPDIQQQMQNALQAQVNYAVRDFEELRKSDDFENSPWMLFSLKRFAEASELCLADSELSDSNVVMHVLLYAAIENRELANGHLDAAVEMLEQGDRDQRFLAESLGARIPFDLRRFLAYSDWPGDKRVYLVAAAMRFPDSAGPLLKLANRLNVEHNFPYWFIADQVKDNTR